MNIKKLINKINKLNDKNKEIRSLYSNLKTDYTDLLIGLKREKKINEKLILLIDDIMQIAEDKNNIEIVNFLKGRLGQ